MNNGALVVGSIGQLAQQAGVSLAETFLNVDVVILVDTSVSMSARDRGEQSRYEVACAELARLQATLPGKLALIAFASQPVFVPGGIPSTPNGGTDLAKALQFAKLADTGGMRFIVISDGEPDDETKALEVAARYRGRIDTIYVGPEGGPGREFLALLAKRQSGKTVTAAHAHELCATTERLLLGGG